MRFVYFLLSTLLLCSCATRPNPVAEYWSIQKQIHEGYTRQNLSKSLDLSVGMSSSQVVSLIGRPIHKELQGTKSSLQWCNSNEIGQTGSYLVAFFQNDLLVLKWTPKSRQMLK